MTPTNASSLFLLVNVVQAIIALLVLRRIGGDVWVSWFLTDAAPARARLFARLSFGLVALALAVVAFSMADATARYFAGPSACFLGATTATNYRRRPQRVWHVGSVQLFVGAAVPLVASLSIAGAIAATVLVPIFVRFGVLAERVAATLPGSWIDRHVAALTTEMNTPAAARLRSWEWVALVGLLLAGAIAIAGRVLADLA